ncbi:MAG TPA: M20/M25/M40 family metallo-hydrolase, partial [Phototrophicaceae bacterium]|nr:M20/M25/M40 family metallo-hydrolase [Phototrophicaceae bacterium]
ALNEIARWAVEQAISLQQIPAPTFTEQRRAAHVADLFRGFDLEQVEQDDLFNVYGLIPGARRGAPAVMISAHTDTVFPETTDLTLKRDGDLLIAPGIGDNCMGVAGMLGLVSFLRRAGITPACDLWIVATTREEGLGDLGGMRAAFARLKPLVSSVINLEGLAFGHVYHAGIAVRRLKITAHTAGGHSWLHFGRPSAIHSLIQLGAKIVALPPPPQNPRTTYNIGIIEGGQSINSIATEASFWLDLRSEDARTLASFEQRVRAEIDAATSADVTFDVQVVGDRPAGYIAPDHPLVQRALDVLTQIGVHGTLETGSTDGNVPLSEGCPTVTVGITRGGNAHRLDEYVEIGPVAAGIHQLILLTLATTDASA